jgi:hypothetical protein
VHPIERLRYVARASGAPQAELVRETAAALASLGFDPPGLVTACRRILDRQPAAGALWWLSARVLTSGEPEREAWAVAEAIDDDPTANVLAEALPDEATVCVVGWPEHVAEALARRGDVEVLAVDALGEGSGLVRRLRAADCDARAVPLSGLGSAAAASDVVLVGATAIGPDGFVAVAGSRAAAAVARHAGVPVLVVGGVGRVLPARLWHDLVARLDQACDPWDADDEVVPLGLADSVVGPSGVVAAVDAGSRPDCPVAPELVRR